MTLGAFNDAPGGEVTFTRVQSTTTGGNFLNNMIAGCNSVPGFKPVCGHKNYCGTDAQAIFIGQKAHFERKVYMDGSMTGDAYACPPGWDANGYVSFFKTNDCSYLGSGGQNPNEDKANCQ